MKKISLFFIGLFLLLVTGCGGNKEVKSMDDFNKAASTNNLTVFDNMSNYSNDYIKEAMVATSEDITLEMVIYDSSEHAKSVQDNQIEKFKNMKSSNTIIKKNNGDNYYKYTMASNGYYLVSSRIDNTLIFTKTLIKNKDIIDSVLDNLGY